MAKFIFSHNPGSQGAKQLAENSGIRRVKHTNSRVRLGRGDILFNWGSGAPLPAHVADAGRVVNPPNLVNRAANKLTFFQALNNTAVRLVPWTADRTVARGWNNKVVVRHELRGHSGAGIEIVDRGVDIPAAPLYTKYVGKATEWRIHVAFGAVIDATRKIRDPDFQGEINWAVRSHANGFIFARNSGQPPEEVVRQAVLTVELLGLDFGAVDVMVGKDSLVYVLEVNTAPGLVGTTVEAYSRAFRNVQ